MMDATRLLVVALAIEGMAILAVLVWIAMRLESGARRRRDPSREIRRSLDHGTPRDVNKHRTTTWRKSSPDYPN